MHNDPHTTNEENFLPGYGKENHFVAPQGYFDTLADRILARIEVEEELGEFAVLAALRDKRTFDVPADYFGAAENKSEYEQELSEFKLLAGIPKPVLKEVDAEYFEAMSANVQRSMEAAEELSAYETLAAVAKQDNFAVSDEYFETLVDRVKERYHAAGAEQPTILQRVWAHIRRPRVAFAYSFVLLIGIGLAYYKMRPAQPVIPVDSDCHTLACLEKREMLNEKTVNEMNDDNLYEMVDVDALEKQLSSDTTAVADSLAEELKAADSIQKNN